MANAAMWAVNVITTGLQAVGVPAGAAATAGQFIVKAAIDTAAATAVSALSNAGRQRAEPPPTTFRADTDAGIPVAFGRCPPSSVLEFAR